MKANIPDRNEYETEKGRSVETRACGVIAEEHKGVIADDEEITIRIERIEDIIALNPAASHNQARGGDSE